MANTIRALLFDFDGLILDTETPEWHVWQRLYGEYGFEYPLERGLQNAGTWGNVEFDAAAHLRELTNNLLTITDIRARHRDQSDVLIAREPVREGVEEYLSGARRLGLKLAVASSSPRHWVESHLRRLGLFARFDAVVTADDAAPGRRKPYPDIYLKAVERLGITPAQAIAFEDTMHGVKAARAAGIMVVAVPNPMTAHLDLTAADLRLTSLSAMPLEELIKRAAQ